MSILSHRGFSISKKDTDDEVIEHHKKQLTILPHVEREEFAHLAQPIRLYQETDQRLYMPRFYATATVGTADNDKLSKKEFEHCPRLEFNGKLRADQQPVIDTALKSLKAIGGAVISLNCGGGKTIIALNAACRLGIPCGVVCHTTAMMKQWHERIQQFCPNARVGVVQQHRAQIEDRDIVIMSVKTVALREYPKGTFDRLGLVVWDEIHLMCTNLFSNAFPKLSTRYSIGLSATPIRKDRCEIIFQHYIGPVVYSRKRARDTSIQARCVTLQMDGIETVHNRFGKIMYTPMAVATANREERTKYLAKTIAKLGSDGRTVLVLGEYVQHLKTLKKTIDTLHPHKQTPDSRARATSFMMAWHRKLGAKSPLRTIPKDIGKVIGRLIANCTSVTTGLYIGEMKNEQRKISEEKDIILGTYKLASVGMDIPALNTLVFASPRKEIEQSVGRIMRQDGGLRPLIIDIIDNHGVFKSQARERKNFYRQYGYTIVHTQEDLDGNVLSTRTVRAKDDVKDDGEEQEEEDTRECLFTED